MKKIIFDALAAAALQEEAKKNGVESKVIYGRTGHPYLLLTSPIGSEELKLSSYAGFTNTGERVVVRNGDPVKESFFTDGAGRWARLIDSTKPEKVEKQTKSSTSPIIALKNGEVICQFISLTGILWHIDDKYFYLASGAEERAELEANGLAYISARSDGSYETLRYIAFDGEKSISVPRFLYNEKNRRFVVGVNFKQMAYEHIKKTGTASIACKNFRLIYARKAAVGDTAIAHTYGAYEASETAKSDKYEVSYCDANGSWFVDAKEFHERYQYHSTDEQGRDIYAPRGKKSVWTHLLGDFIGCMPNWGDSMTAMSNPQVNITNPEDVYACSYIEFFGKEDTNGAYIVIDELVLGMPEYWVTDFGKAMQGFVETSFGVPKSEIEAKGLLHFVKKVAGISESQSVIAEQIATAAA